MSSQPKVYRSGNSLAVRIPAHLAKQLGWVSGTPIKFGLTDETILTVQRDRPRYKLADLLAGMLEQPQ